MSARQQWVTAAMALLMLGTIFAMPAHEPRTALSAVRGSGSVMVAPVNRAETPHEQVRDLTYN